MTVDFSLFPEECARRWLFFLTRFSSIFRSWDAFCDSATTVITSQSNLQIARDKSACYFFLLSCTQEGDENPARATRARGKERYSGRKPAKRPADNLDEWAGGTCALVSTLSVRSPRYRQLQKWLCKESVKLSIKKRVVDTHPRLDSRADTYRLSR